MTDTLHRTLRAVGVSLALLTAAAPMALADPPGDLFLDFNQATAASSAPMQTREHASPQTMAAATPSAPAAATLSTRAADSIPQASGVAVRLSPSRSMVN
jgi:hypothetical protein